MALLKVSITKQTSFQGDTTEQFGNVYTYTVASADAATAQTLIDGLIAAERPIYSTLTKFVEARAFTDKETQGIFDGSPETYLITTPTVSGTAADNPTLYRECAYLVKFPLARKRKLAGGLGRQRMLKKWIHATTMFGILNDASQSGSVPLPPAVITPLKAYAVDVADIAGNKLTAIDGTIPGEPVVHPYLEHRQFPPGRKEDNITLTP